jgi:hypothetical protein
MTNEKELTFNFMFMAQKNKDKFSFFLLFLIFFPPCTRKQEIFFKNPQKAYSLVSRIKPAIERKSPAIIIATVGSQPIRWESLKPK